jgi:hypothetical protein
MQFLVTYKVVVDVEDEQPEEIYSEAASLMQQSIGHFDYREA